VIESVKKTGRLVTVEEGFPQILGRRQKSPPACSAGVRLSRCAGHHDAGKDVPMPYAANLEKLALPNVGEVIDAVKAVTYTG
jgi:pyruvate dehydrogenase E1 component beta subunit